MTSKREVADPRESLRQLYRDLRTARLNELFYSRKLKFYSLAIGVHDILIALGTGASPVAFWKASKTPTQHQAWIVISMFTFVLGALKPTLRLTEKVKMLAELRTQYSELFFNLSEIRNDAASQKRYSGDMHKEYKTLRRNFSKLAGKDPDEGSIGLIRKLQQRVNAEIPPSTLWMPDEDLGGENKETDDE